MTASLLMAGNIAGGGIGTPLYRVACGNGTDVAATDGGPTWLACQRNGNESIYFAGSFNNNSSAGTPNSLDASVPDYVPSEIWGTERWGAWGYDFPVTAGNTYLLRLYLMNHYDGTNQIGDRIFSVSVEGVVPAVYSSMDLIALYGHRVAAMREYQVTAADTTLEVRAVINVENPCINGIELREL